MVSSMGLVDMHDVAAGWTRTRGSVFRILESVEDILKTLESDALRKLREDELNELEAQGIGEDLYIILREIARRVLFGGFWKRDLRRMEGSKCGSPPSWFERDQFRTLIVQSNHRLKIGSYFPANPPPSKYILQSLKAGSSRKMALSRDNSLANLCSFVYPLSPDSSLSAS
jgi:hypothetical protein